jgi:hypothetical protein
MFGFHTSIARTIAKEGRPAYPLVRKAFLWVICVSAVAILVANPIVNRLYANGEVPTNFALYLALLLMAVCLLNLNMAFFQGDQKMGHVSAIMALDSLARGGAVALAMTFALQAQSILLAMGLFALVFELVVTSRIFPRIRAATEEAMPFRELTRDPPLLPHIPYCGVRRHINAGECLRHSLQPGLPGPWLVRHGHPLHPAPILAGQDD